MKIGEVIQSADWKAEKHVPVIEAPTSAKANEAFDVNLQVGTEIPHPNTTEHHIRWIKLYFKPNDGKFVYELASFEFHAHGESVKGANSGPAYIEPIGRCRVKLAESGTLLCVAYCNIHGLWENSQAITIQS